MATEIGTATDYLDLVTKFRDFATGANSPQSGLSWVAVRDTSGDSPNGGEYELILRGNGDSSPEKEIFFGIKTYSNSGDGRYNWEVRGMTGFNAGSPEGSVAFEDQPGAQSIPGYVPLRNASISYWFFGNGRRLIMVAKTGTAYQFLYAGFFNPFATETEYPYPMAIFASSYNVDQVFNDNDLDYASIPHPAGDNSQVVGLERGSCWVRMVDGQWYAIKHYSGTSTESVQQNRLLWPMCDGASSDFDAENKMVDGRDFHTFLRSQTAGGVTSRTLAQTPGSPDDISPLWPLTILFVDPSRQILGELDNCFFVSGGGGLAAEDNIIDVTVSPQENYLVFTNIHRTDNWHYYAIKDE